MESPISGVAATSDTDGAFTILFVDDEPNILSSLKRLMRSTPYRVLVAEGAASALSTLELTPVDMVVSDMRMPGRSGAEFLADVYQLYPDTLRVLMTGYADMQSTIDAINNGKISRYISKPWNDEELVQIIDSAFEIKRLQRDKTRLTHIVDAQVEELKQLNQSLEQKVKERTQELEQLMSMLELSNDKLKKSFLLSVRVFANLIEMRAGSFAGHSKRVADIARQIAIKMNLSDTEKQDIFLAGLLHDIGKIGLPDSYLSRPFLSLSPDERNVFVKHTIKGQAALMAIEQLQTPAKYLRSHNERYDGLGYPEQLQGTDIPLGARILAVSNLFDELQQGTYQAKVLNKTAAIADIVAGRGKRFDPKVVDAFAEITSVDAHPAGREILVKSQDLKVGMTLSRDLIADGVLLLAKDYILEQRLIEQILHFERSDDSLLKIYVWVK